MHKHLYILITLLFLSCQAPVSAPKASGLAIPFVAPEEGTDTIFLTAAEVDSMPITNPEFFQPVFDEPDTAYFHSKCLGGEAAQDEYCRIYGHFLRQKNGVEKFAVRRVQLVKLMRAINSLEGTKRYGGTYFGHMYGRIEGYSEYELQQPWQETPFSKVRKDSFLLALNQSLKLPEFELDDDSRRLPYAKSDIQKIDSLISSNAFLLEQAIKFHRARYTY